MTSTTDSTTGSPPDRGRPVLLIGLVILLVLVVLMGLYWRNQQASTPPATPTVASGQALPTDSGAPNPELIGPIWKLLEIVAVDGTATAASNPSAYTLELRGDGSANAKADCNTGAGTYAAGASTINLDIAFTKVACGPDSLFDRYSRALLAAGTYTIVDQGLYLQSPGTEALRFTKGDAAPPAPVSGPSAVISMPEQATVGQLVTFDASQSRSQAPIALYGWSFGDGGQATGAKVSYAYDLAGTYLVELTVVDVNRKSSTSTASIRIVAAPSVPPTALLSGPSTALVGDDVTFDASRSQAGSSPIASYSWNLGGGEMPADGNSAAVTTSYEKAGTYDVIVTVTDKAGLSDSGGATIVIEAPDEPAPAPPTAVIAVPSQATEGQLLTFDASRSSGAEPLVGYLWDFGDGGKANAVMIQHAFAKQGIYVVTLTVVDTLGARGTASTNVSVSAAARKPPTAKISGPGQVTAGQEMTLDGSGSQAGSSPIVSYSWNLGDASGTSLGTTSSVRGTPMRPGVYQVVLTVTDAEGLSGSASQEVKVSAPLAGVIWQLANSLPEAPVTLGFSGKELGGSTGCNAYSGQFEATPDGQLATTAISQSGSVCAANVMAQESAYLAALEAAQSYAIEVDTLVIRHPSGALQFVARGAIPH